MIDFADQLRKRQGPQVADWLSEDFLGQAWPPMAIHQQERAAFDRVVTTWGKAKIFITLQGEDADRNPIQITGFAYAGVSKSRGEWKLDRWSLTSLEQTVRKGGYLFESVAEAAGVAHQVPRCRTHRGLVGKGSGPSQNPTPIQREGIRATSL